MWFDDRYCYEKELEHNEQLELDLKKHMIKLKNIKSREYRNSWKKDRSKQLLREANCGITSREANKLKIVDQVLKLINMGLTQKKVAASLNITQQYVSKILKESRKEGGER